MTNTPSPRSLDAAAPAQAGEWVLPRGWRIERVDARTIAVCGRGIRTHVEFGDSFYPFFLALSAAPPAPQPATAGQPPTDYGDSGSKSVVPTAEHWRRAVSDFVLEQGVHLAANDWTHIEQRAVALAREEGK